MKVLFNKDNILDKIVLKDLAIKLLCAFVGAFLVSIAYHAFVTTNTLVTGGVSGLAIIINKVFDISETAFINITTISLLILSFILLGLKKTSDAIIGYIAYAVMLYVTEPLAPYIQVSFDSFLLSVIFYATISGIGYGLIYRPGYNTGGSDSIVAICQKYFVFPYAVISNILNTGIIVLGAATFGITKSIYAIIFLFVCNFITDRIILGVSTSKICFIKSKRTEEVERILKEDLEVGYTLIDSTNGIGLLKKSIIFCVLPSDRFYDLKRELLKIDKKIEIISKDCYTVEGGKINKLIKV